MAILGIKTAIAPVEKGGNWEFKILQTKAFAIAPDLESIGVRPHSIETL
jgi:hypothetical protein